MDYPEIPGYTIKHRLGQGGMASVYLAVQDNFDRLVALKVMAAHLVSDPSFGERFLREARIVAQMSHRNFVPVFDVGQHGDLHYMSMEYLPAGDLKAAMASGLPLTEGLRIAQEIASGLHYAAGKNFVHRDIKPENILFREDHSSVICDFGIARSMDSTTQMTVVGTVVGTAFYMSPEQAKAEQIDGRSDLYGLGIIIYEMLTGSVPYGGDSAIAVSIKHVNNPIPMLPEHLAAFQPFIDKALAKHPDDRFQNGGELIDALQALEEQEYALIESLSTTVRPDASETRIIGTAEQKELTRIQSFGARSSAGIPSVSGRHSRRAGKRRQAAQAEQSSGGRGARFGIFLLLFLLIAAGGTYWYSLQPGNYLSQIADGKVLDSDSSLGQMLDAGLSRLKGDGEPEVTESAPEPGIQGKADELNRLAAEAFQSGALYQPNEANAQYYLTTLLALYPDDERAQQGINSLYRVYLNNIETAIRAGDFETADEILDQASQITYYIRNQAYIEEQGELRNELIVAQQTEIIALERERDIDALLNEAQELIAADKLTTPAGGNAYDTYQKVLSLDPESQEAIDGLRGIAGQFVERARAEAAELEFTPARASLAAAAQIFPGHPEIELMQSEIAQLELSQSVEDNTEQAAELVVIESNREIEELLTAAEVDIAEYRLTSPEGDNALEKFVRVLELDASNEAANQGIENVAGRYIQIAQTAITDGRLDEAQRYLDEAKKLSPASPDFPEAQRRLIEARESSDGQDAANEEVAQRLDSLWEEYEADIDAGRLYAPGDNSAMLKLRKILELDPSNETAIERQAALLELMANRAEAKISEGQLDEAAQAIDYLASVAAMDSARIASLREALVIAGLQEQQANGVFSSDSEPQGAVIQATPVAAEPEQAIDADSDTIESLY